MADTTTTIVGNLTDTPELRFTPNGAPVANFTVAVTPRVKDGDDWKDGETSFFRCTAWRSLAEHLADSLSKGDRVMIYGTLRQRSWETPEGDKRSVVEVQVDELGPSLKWATAKPERTRERATAASSSSTRARRDGEFTDEPPF
jgi:single-strand DNA-binding protein